MADGFEAYHVPQQSRRDKLRCVENLQGCTGLLPLYDPSLISSDLLTCADLQQNVNGRIINVPSSSSSSSHHLYMDPQSSLHLTPSSIQDLNNNNHFIYASQNLTVPDQSFNGNNGLSLSLSSHHARRSNLPLELNLQRYESSVFGNNNGLSRSARVPFGPFTGYASILKGSRFLKPAQQLLEGICDVGCGNYGEKISADSVLMDPPLESLSRSGVVDDGGENGRKKSRLISMLDEVYRRYKQYYQQVQSIVASFETVPGLSNAAPFANLALKAMSKHFCCLKNAITDQLQFTTKSHGHINYGNGETPRSGNSDRGLYGQRSSQNLGFVEHQPVWRPQRGLPERAVNVLRAWLFEHFLHPYPTDTDKLMLAKQTGLSRNQVSNWFINARVRLWKPMVEEIHTLETRQGQKPSQREEQRANRATDHHHSLASENPSTSTQRIQDLPSKRTRNNFPNNPMGSEEPMNLLYNNSSCIPHAGIGVSTVGGSGNVSLTLGLHQNNGIGLSEPFTMNAAHRFGLDANSEGFVVGSFEAQNRQFGRDIIGGQLLHDFVG